MDEEHEKGTQEKMETNALREKSDGFQIKHGKHETIESKTKE